jgi:hypothetical protein
VVLLHYFCHVEKRVYLSHVVEVTCAVWWTVIRIEAGVGDLVQRIENDQAKIGYLVVERSRGQVTLFAVYTLHEEMRSMSFLVSLKTKVDGFPGLGLKTGSCGLMI